MIPGRVVAAVRFPAELQGVLLDRPVEEAQWGQNQEKDDPEDDAPVHIAQNFAEFDPNPGNFARNPVGKGPNREKSGGNIDHPVQFECVHDHKRSQGQNDNGLIYRRSVQNIRTACK